MRRELLAGLTTLMTMAYVVVVLFSGALFLLLTLSDIANKSSAVFPIG